MFRTGDDPSVVIKRRSKPKRAYHHGNLRRAFLDAAIELLATDGVSGLTLRNVARRVGVTAAAPYHHFADKEAITAALATEGFAMLTERMLAGTSANAGSPLGKLRSLSRAYLEFAELHPQHYRLMFGAAAAASGSNCDPLPEASASYGLLHEVLREAQEEGLIGRQDVALQAMLAWALMHGLAMMWIDGTMHHLGADSPQAAGDYATSVLIAGLAAGK